MSCRHKAHNDATPYDSICMQTASGKMFSLLSPDAEQIDFAHDIAPQLARQTRFNGATESFYSIAQHCALGADAIYQDTRRPDLAAYFLLHDAHEAYIGDIPTPVVTALARLGCVNSIGDETHNISHVIGILRDMIDLAIWQAANLPPPSAAIRMKIMTMNLRMLATEKRDLMRPCSQSWGDQVEQAEPIRGPRIKPLPWPKATDLWLNRLKQYCPGACNGAPWVEKSK
jgi:hypothetical protein